MKIQKAPWTATFVALPYLLRQPILDVIRPGAHGENLTPGSHWSPVSPSLFVPRLSSGHYANRVHGVVDRVPLSTRAARWATVPSSALIRTKSRLENSSSRSVMNSVTFVVRFYPPPKRSPTWLYTSRTDRTPEAGIAHIIAPRRAPRTLMASGSARRFNWISRMQ